MHILSIRNMAEALKQNVIPLVANRPTILLIDDSAQNVYAVARILRDASYNIIDASNAAEGLEKALNEKPDMIILDVQLPDQNGLDLCRKMKANPALQGIPILMTSAAFVEGRDKAHGLDSGADGYLATPFTPLELVATIRSLLRVKAVEAALRASEERYELAMQAMNDGLWEINYNEDNVLFSTRYKSQLGYTHAEFPDDVDFAFRLVHPDDVETTKKALNKVLTGEAPEYRALFRMRHKDGSWRWVDSRGAPVKNEQGEIVRIVGGHSDVTEQKLLEKELTEARVKAENANIAKTEFLTNMSHEIRTPMNAIIGLSHILSTTELTDKQKEFITTLQLSAESLLELINDMLDIARIEENMVEFENLPFSLNEFLDNILSMLSVKAKEKKLELKVIYNGKVSKRFLGDTLRMQQVLVNIINNAIKFTLKGSVKIEVTEKTEASGISKLAFKVIDTGIGIPQDKLYKIFDKFTQVDSSITRKYGGSGLGLSISKALVDKMGGNIHVSSLEGKGTVFTINIPLEVDGSSHNTQIAKNNDASPQGTTERHILLVEDYKPNVLVATTLLSNFGYSYDVAIDGAEALEKLKTNNYDAVLMDVQMPVMDGYEAARQLRAWEKENNKKPIPVIAMTAHALTGDKEKCLAAGMTDYISKPFNANELQEKLVKLTA